MRIDGKNDEDNEQIDRSGQKHDLLVVFVVVVQINNSYALETVDRN